ncbi:MAG: MFS transporter [Alphaproteobacteria bacterium]
MNASISKTAERAPDSAARQWTATGIVGAGHFVSHFYVLCLAALLPAMARDLQVGYVQLGLISTSFFIAATAVQMPVGMLVDRIGARRMLWVGMLVVSSAITLAGMTDSYLALVGLFVVAGAGNSVFHPCDYVILSASVEKARHGRAFSFHSLCGTGGFAVAPLVMGTLSALFDWRFALVVTGLIGVAIAFLMLVLSGRLRDDVARKSKRGGQFRSTWQAMMSRRILAHFVYFATSSMATSAIGSFSIVVLVAFYGVSETLAGGVLSANLIAAVVGVMIGGVLADRTQRRDLVLVTMLSVAALATAAVATGALPFWLAAVLLTVAGLTKGIISPSRDLMVRDDAPPALLGAVVAFVTIGFTIGNATAPVVSGWLVDFGSPLAVYWFAAALTLVAISCVLISRDAPPLDQGEASHS